MKRITMPISLAVLMATNAIAAQDSLNQLSDQLIKDIHSATSALTLANY